MGNEIKIYEQGLEEYPKIRIFIGNLMMIGWIVLGSIGCWLLSPLAGRIYLAFAIIMVFIILRKLVCTNCYYYNRWCSIGWGKVSGLFFKKGDIGRFKTAIGSKIAPLTYGLLILIPLILIIISVIKEFAIAKIVVLMLLLLISFYSGSIGRKKSCADCRMRLICPGSAVK